MSPTAVFVNRSARKGRGAARAAAALRALEQVAAELGQAAPRLVDTGSATDVRTRAAALAAEGAERVVVIGGDGLAHHAVQALAGTGTVLGVVPVGTGNDFATALGLPTSPVEAARTALGPDRRIDLLRGPAGWALTVATTGFAAAVNERAEAMTRPRGSSRYSIATMLELPRLRARDLVLRVEAVDGTEAEHRVRTVLVAVGNTAYFGGGMRICPDADPDDGLLDIVLIDAVGRLELLRHFGRVFRGTHVRHRAVHVHRGRAVTVEATGADTGAVAVRADGEAWGGVPARIETVPGALRVAAP